MRVRVVCGFLGSGKTTFVRAVLSRISGRTAVLVNEFGQLGIDGGLIKQGGSVDVVELPTGCICCSLRSDLVNAVREIRERFNPEKLIIEPTGIAAPSGILEALSAPGISEGLQIEPVIGIVDSTSFVKSWEAETFGTFFRDQVVNSDIILANKKDLVSPELMERTVRLLRQLNPTALIIPTVYCSAELPEFERQRGIEHFRFTPDLDSVSVSSDREYRREEVEQVVNALDSGKYGDIIRAKGVFRTKGGYVSFDHVPGHVSWGSYQGEGPGKFVFIGARLEGEALRAALG